MPIEYNACNGKNMHNTPLRIAQILNKMESGGIEAVVMNYYRSINKDLVQFDFFYEESSSFVQKESLLKLGAKAYPIPKYSSALKYHKALYNYLKSGKYKIAHVHLNTMSVFALFAAWRAGVPVRICHNHSTAHKNEGKRTLLKYLLRPFNKIFATDYFACGEQAGRWMYNNRCYDKNKVTVIPNAIDTAKFGFNEQARENLRAELNIAQDAFVIGHVGRFMLQKNHLFLIELFAELFNFLPNATLLLVGDGELEQEVRQKSKELNVHNSVIFTGVRQDANLLYSVMDVFALPSFYEGMPVVAWEAQANGLPCVFSSNISQESILGGNAKMLDIDSSQAISEWSRALQSSQRLEAPLVPDISEFAYKLESFYISQTCKRG